jgi:eukaryotic-like serine/threonine-protein kinase
MGVPDDLRSALADRYRLDRELGRGGMAVVYLAHDLRHDRPVALKVLRPELAEMLGLERFQREIHIAARLQHPHILPVHDSGDAAGQLWFTMPFVEGESLRERLSRERQLPVEDALRIAVEAARALDYAHQQGVIHRDVKPENILLTRDGSTLVADFGIARALGAGDERLTQTGFALGTPAYMSPEQAAGEKALDGRTDLYSLASVLYEMLAGEAPYTGSTAQAIMTRRLTEPAPSVRMVRPAVPPAAGEAIRKALAPMPADRFATAGEFAKALTQADGRSGEYANSAEMPTTPARLLARSPARPLFIALTAVLLLGAGVLFAWRRTAAAPTPTGTHVVAVLPFENLGDSAEAYFADGVSDEVRTKLGQVAGLEIIARGSSIEYRHTAKRPDEIARELGADYLLTGTVRWQKSGAASRVRVTPELVDVRAGHAARARWGQQFDASLTDVFQVQADIAAKVADALGVALADSTQRRLTAKPTESLAAYDEFLKGEAASQGLTAEDPPSLRRAITSYERAVALDSTFATAWAHLSRARSQLAHNSVPSPTLDDEARAAMERARALRPTDPEVYMALAQLYYVVNPIDNRRALEAAREGLRYAPDNVELLGASGSAQLALGRWDSATAPLTRAAALDPRSPSAARRLAVTHLFLRQYDPADSAADRAVALAPTNPALLMLKVMVRLARGDLPGARTVLRRAADRIDADVLLAYFANFNDLYWVLDDDAQRQVLAMRPAAFDGDRGWWGLVLAELHGLRGDRARSAIYADSARLALEEQVRIAPIDATREASLGLALAYLGRKAEAVRHGQRAVDLMPVSRDADLGNYIQHQLVRIYLLVGEPEAALDQLEPLLEMPSYLSPGWLRIDPTFDPIRNHPRFKRLVEGTA